MNSSRFTLERDAYFSNENEIPSVKFTAPASGKSKYSLVLCDLCALSHGFLFLFPFEKNINTHRLYMYISKKKEKIKGRKIVGE